MANSTITSEVLTNGSQLMAWMNNRLEGDSVLKPSFVAIEGVDGSGKTTTAALLAKKLGAVCVKTPPKDYQFLRGHFDSQPRLTLARFFFYVASLCEAAESINSLLAAGTSVVVDRWTLSTRLYHEQLLGRDLSSHLEGLALPRPDSCFIMQPPLPIILGRLRKRVPGHDYSLEQDERFISAIYDRYKAARDVIHLDPGNGSIDDVVNHIMMTLMPLHAAREVCHA